jgi:hypothetical protein
MNPYTPTLLTLFEGNKEAYGKFHYSEQVRDDGKVKGHGITVRKPVTPSLWDDHLAGKTQLGIIPINPENQCKFGAIDIDDYNVDRKLISERIYKLRLPLVQFRSKSGGAHLFLFLKDYASAALMQRRLKEFASIVGYGNSEIFPKQTRILKERGDVGQWINMPYFDAVNTQRFAIRAEDNEEMNLGEFINYVDTRTITAQELKDYKIGVSEEELPHGPPCLQILVQQGFPEGTRNQGLFALGVYAQKANPDKWKEVLETYNSSYMKPQLSPKEVLTVIGSLAKKEYNYPCKKQPICSYCNASLCRTRKYGVGEAGSGMPVLGSLTKLDSDPPIWFIDVEDTNTTKRIELTTDDLASPMLFQKLCMRTINIMPPIMKREMWQSIVSELLATVNVIPVPIESTPKGQLMQHLQDFCTQRVGGEDAECLHRGLVYNHEGYHYFRLQDFVDYLDRKRFIAFRIHQIHSIFKDNDVKHKGIHMTKGRYLNVYFVKAFTTDVDKFEPPPQTGDIPF